eukprot:UN02010
MTVTANTKVMAFTEDLEGTALYHPRTFTAVRSSTWKYPFGLRWMKDVDVSVQLQAFICDSSHTACTVRSVASVVSIVQTEVDPLKASNHYGVVVASITTKVAYPYVFVTGTHTDDPPQDQISTGSAIGTNYNNIHGHPGTDGYWAPPLVETTMETVEGIAQTVDTVMTFQFEDLASCTNDPNLAFEEQIQNECEQHWNLEIRPTGDSCYINGDYEIKFSARCAYGKEVCTFLPDGLGKYQNGVSTTFTLKSTKMCPVLVQDVDLTGTLCSTGRAIDGHGYTTACLTDPAYIQNEDVFFRTEVSSTIAAISKNEIIRIYASQTYGFLTDATPPRHDLDYNSGKTSKFLIWE